MKHVVSTILLWASATLITSCAGYKVLPENLKQTDQEGLRFYRPQPYLLVSDAPLTAAEKTAAAPARLAYEIIYLPDYSKGYVLQRQAGMGTVDASVTLTNGWMLSTLGMKTDSQLPQTIEAISKLIPTILAAPLGAKKAGAPALAPGLYKIVIDSNGAASLAPVQ